MCSSPRLGSQFETSEPLRPYGLVYDAADDQLLVLDRTEASIRVVAVDAFTGEVGATLVEIGVDSNPPWASIDLSPDGRCLVTADRFNVLVFEREAPSTPFFRGDANRSGSVDSADAVTTLAHLKQGAHVECRDANADGVINIADAILVLRYVNGAGVENSAP